MPRPVRCIALVAVLLYGSSGGGEVRGNTSVNKATTSDPDEYLVATAVMRRITHDLIPHLVALNFPSGTGRPVAKLGGVDWNETNTQLNAAVTMETKLGRPVEDEYLYRITGFPKGKPKPPDPNAPPT